MALTVGLKTITDANEVLIIVYGSQKSNALRECLEGNINNTWTITVLQNHPKCIIACDKDATCELKVKTVNYFDNLQKNTNIFGRPYYNNLDRFINKNEKIIVFSPHPDDDVIGCGGTLQKFNRNDVTIVYMTDGSNGYDTNKYEYNPRKQEAILSLKVLDYKKDNIIFLNLPFYKSKTKTINNEDSKIISKLFEKIQPQHIFICYDTDPNKTHDKCFNIIKNSIFNNTLNKVWLYKSAWGKWDQILNYNMDEIDYISYIDKYMFEKKKISIMMHDSQDPPKVYYDTNKPFYEIITDTNNSILNPGYYEEHFKIITKTKLKSINLIQ